MKELLWIVSYNLSEEEMISTVESWPSHGPKAILLADDDITKIFKRN